MCQHPLLSLGTQVIHSIIQHLGSVAQAAPNASTTAVPKVAAGGRPPSILSDNIYPCLK